MRQVVVPDILEPKVAVEAREPAREGVEHLCQGRMDVKVVFSPNVLTCECSKVDFIEPSGRGMRDEGYRLCSAEDLHDLGGVFNLVEPHE